MKIGKPPLILEKKSKFNIIESLHMCTHNNFALMMKINYFGYNQSINNKKLFMGGIG